MRIGDFYIVTLGLFLAYMNIIEVRIGHMGGIKSRKNAGGGSRRRSLYKL